MSSRTTHPGFTLLELAISLAIVMVLLSVLLPALASARMESACAECASNLKWCGEAWHLYLEDQDGTLPYVPVQPAWHYAGVRFSAVDDAPFLDTRRPLSSYFQRGAGVSPSPMIGVLRCPADNGIHGDSLGVGTGRRTAFRSFGTSYRANAMLLDAQGTGLIKEHRGLRRDEIITAPSRMVVMGDPLWYEAREKTGRNAVWHGDADRCNLLFLDGTVKYMTILPRPRVGPAVFEPRVGPRPGSSAP